MKFGIREICDVVLKAKTAQKVGNKVFYKNEPVLYFDSLKTSSLEGASTTVYAQGGRGNARLIAWEGERTVTFTMEDALISPEGFSILTGAGLVQGEETPVIMHTTEQTDKVEITKSGDDISYATIELSYCPYFGAAAQRIVDNSSAVDTAITGLTVDGKEDYIYIMRMEDGQIISEPYIPSEVDLIHTSTDTWKVVLYAAESHSSTVHESDDPYSGDNITTSLRKNDLSGFYNGCVVFVDYYTARKTGAYQINITPDKFGGNYYLEASTLFRDTNGTDLPAEFVIPNCKIQSNFTFSMASSGDPSTFTFTMDAFPDYTRWDKTKKVFAAIQVFDIGAVGADLDRLGTPHDSVVYNEDGTKTTLDSTINTNYTNYHKPFIEV